MLFFITGAMHKADGRPYLNTSHVILYQSLNWILQMISIYLNTSHVILYPGLSGLLPTAWRFKYISCYSLSFSHYAVHVHLSDLNTSHVILYQSTGVWQNRKILHLNTSHVILYRY